MRTKAGKDGRSFSAAAVVGICGIHYETLNYWTKTGLAAPSIAAANGSGSRRAYSFTDLVAIRAALKMRKAGIFTHRALRPVIAALRQRGFESPEEFKIYTTPAGEVLVTPTVLPPPAVLLLDFRFDGSGIAIEVGRRVDSWDKSQREVKK